MPMEMSMRATGRTTRRTAAEYTLMLMEADMKESGSRTSSTDSVVRGGPIVPHMGNGTFEWPDGRKYIGAWNKGK